MEAFQALIALKSIIVFSTIAGLCIFLYRKGKLTGLEQAKENIRKANERAEKVREDVEDRIRNTPDTVLDDQTDTWMRD